VTASDGWLRLLIGKPEQVEKAKANVLRLQEPRYARAVVVVCVLAGALMMGAALAFTLQEYAIASGLLVGAFGVAAVWGFVISDRLWSRAHEQQDQSL
jgi:predicted PurR-regulated permease PerM